MVILARTEQRRSPPCRLCCAWATLQERGKEGGWGQKALKQPSHRWPDFKGLGSGLSQLWENRAVSKTLRRETEWDKGSPVAGGKQGTGAQLSRTGQRTSNEHQVIWTTACALLLPYPSAWNLLSKQVLFSLCLSWSKLPSCPLWIWCCHSKSFRAEKPNWETKKTYCLTYTFFTLISFFQL